MDTNSVEIVEGTWYRAQDLPKGRLGDEELSSWIQEIEQKGGDLKQNLGLSRPALRTRGKEGFTELKASGITGLVNTQGIDIHVKPKFFSEQMPRQAWQASILTMLRRANNRQLAYSRAQNLEVQSLTFADHLALAYADALKRASRFEDVHQYSTRSEESNYVRGRINVQRQLSSILNRPHKIQSEVDYRDTENSINKILHWSGRKLESHTSNPQVKHTLENALGRLPAIKSSPEVPSRLPLTLPRQYDHYKEALEIAEMVATGRGHGQQQRGVFTGYGYVLNMAGVYEDFIESSVSRTPSLLGWSDYEFRAQVSNSFARPITASGESVEARKSYSTRPDNVLYGRGSPELLVDAKYKNVYSDNGDYAKPDRSDVYQLTASMVSHGVSRGILLFPHVVGESVPTTSNYFWRIDHSGGQPLVVAAATVDISNLTSKERVEECDRVVAEAVEEVMDLEIVEYDRTLAKAVGEVVDLAI